MNRKMYNPEMWRSILTQEAYEVNGGDDKNKIDSLQKSINEGLLSIIELAKRLEKKGKDKEKTDTISTQKPKTDNTKSGGAGASGGGIGGGAR